MPVDSFAHHADSIVAPARHAFAVVPSDAVELSPLPKALLIGGAGTVSLRAIDSSVDVQIAVLAGQLLPIRARFVRAAGTSATAIIGLA